MSDTSEIVFLCILIFLSVVILMANAFTILIFWIHRHKLKRTFLLVINLTLADLLVGFTAILETGAVVVLPRLSKTNHKGDMYSLSAFLYAFSSASVFFLVLISLERAFALIWPLRHRATSTIIYIYIVAIGWFAGIAMGVFYFLSMHKIFDFEDYAVGFSVVINFCLVTICVSCLSIRKKINNRNLALAIEFTRNGQRGQCERNTRLSKTFFIVIGVSLAFWAPGVTFFSVAKLCAFEYPQFVNYILAMLHLSNSFINPMIYSLRMPIFMKTLKQSKNKFKIQNRSKKYTISNENL